MLVRRLAITAVLAGAAASPALLSAQTITAVQGTPYVVTAPVQGLATGSSMTGMLVTATFSDGVSLTQSWGSLGTLVGGIADYGVVFDGRLRLSHLDVDTYPLVPWYMRRLGVPLLASLSFDGAPGNTAFDRSTGFAEGTPGSSLGGDYADLNAFWNGSSAVYSDVVAVGAEAPVGDLYRRLTITFAQDLPRTPITGARELYFQLDTDRVGPAVPAVVPEPGTWVLLASGLAGLVAVRRRRARG